MHTTTKLGTIVVISLLLGGCSFFGGDGSDAAASVSASAAASPVFQAKEVPPITASELDKPQTDSGLNVEITLQAAGYNPAGSGSVIYVLVKNLTVHLEGANPITEGTIGLDLPLGPGAAANLQYAFDAPASALSNARFTIGNIIYQGDLANV